jgi:hypothetical protein
MFEYSDNKQMNLQKVLWYALVGALMLLSSIGGAWATSLTKTVTTDHTTIAVLSEELHQIHQDMEDIKGILRKRNQ